MRMQYAGANNPLYLISDVDGDPKLKEKKPDRMPIGYYQGKDRTFTNHEIQLLIGDTFYIFSDGFMDQKDILDKTLSEWMGNNSQVDDILVIGVRV